MFHRRDAMMRLGQVGLGAMTLPHLLRSESAEIHDPLGRPHRVVDGNPLTSLFSN